MKNKLLEILGIEKVLHSIQALVETRVAMIKEEVEERVVNAIANAIPLLLVVFSICLFVVFGSITLGLYLTKVTGSAIQGFGIITIFYLLVAIVLYLVKGNKSYSQSFYKQIKKRK